MRKRLTMRKPKVLLTGFEPFDGATFNISEKIVSEFSNLRFDNFSVETEILTVDEKGSNVVCKKLKNNKFDCIIMLGYNNKIKKINVEHKAINKIQMKIKDNSGRMIDSDFIISSAPNELFSTISLEKLFQESPIEFDFSSNAGTFICNETYFRTLEKIYSKNILDKQNKILPCVFIHLPLDTFEPVSKQIEFISWAIQKIIFQEVLDVVAAVIRNEKGEILVAKRKHDQPHPGKWEFPGGKLLPQENDVEGLKREINEELNLNIEVTSFCGEITHQYEEYFVKLKALNSKVIGDISLMKLYVHDEILWLPVEKLGFLDYLDANLKLVKIIQNQS